MKYTIIINQAGIAEAGLADKTDVVDWSIIDYIKGWMTNPSATKRNDHIWINIKHLIEQMPLLGLKGKGAVSNRIKKLTELGLISKEHDSEKRLYCRITEYCHNAIEFRAGEKKPITPRSSNEGGVHENEQGGVHTDEQGVHTDEHTVVNHLLDNQKQIRDIKHLSDESDEMVEQAVFPPTSQEVQPIHSPGKGVCKSTERHPAIEHIFRHYCQIMNKPTLELKPARIKLIRNRLKDWDVDQLLQAINGCAASRYHQGDNPARTVYNSLELILRNDEKVQSFIDRANPIEFIDGQRAGVSREEANRQAINDLLAGGSRFSQPDWS